MFEQAFDQTEDRQRRIQCRFENATGFTMDDERLRNPLGKGRRLDPSYLEIPDNWAGIRRHLKASMVEIVP